MQTRPNVNDPVVLRDGADREHRSRVEDLAPGMLTVARPLDLPAEHTYRPSTQMLVTWSCPRGIAVLPTQLLGTHTERGLALWSMAVMGEGWVEQRRRFVRVPVNGPLSLRTSGDESGVEAVAAHLLEVSEGALRCTVDVDTADDLLVNDTEVTVGFRLGDGAFAIPARVGVRRPSSRPAERTELVVVFDEPVRHADALRKQIFALQLRNRRATPDTC